MTDREQLQKLVEIGRRFRMTPIVDDDFVGLKIQFDLELEQAQKHLAEPQAQPKTLSEVKCVVGCHGLDGPDLFFVKVQCTQEQYENGDHYEAAEGYVRENYDVDAPFWVCDENDSPGPLLIPMSDWGDAPVTWAS